MELFVFTSDIDECVKKTDNCSQNCNNTIGSYQCYCNDGYTLDSDDLHTCNGTDVVYVAEPELHTCNIVMCVCILDSHQCACNNSPLLVRYDFLRR